MSAPSNILIGYFWNSGDLWKITSSNQLRVLGIISPQSTDGALDIDLIYSPAKHRTPQRPFWTRGFCRLLGVPLPQTFLCPKTFRNSKKKKHSCILLNARKGICRALTARMSYVLSLESRRVWHSSAILIEASITIAAAYKSGVGNLFSAKGHLIFIASLAGHTKLSTYKLACYIWSNI
jgi:hypothetical protein